MSIFDLAGKVAVITGGSGTLGSGMAKGLVDAGARVCVIGRDASKAQHVASSLSPNGDKAMAISADVTKVDEVEQAARFLLDRWGQVDILVNAAGGNRPDAMTA